MKCVLLLTCLSSFLTVSARPWMLQAHSIKNIPEINSLGAFWQLSGTVVPSHRSLVITAGQANRIGALWSTTPILTNDFEATFTFTAEVKEPKSFQDDGFAFWYVKENATAPVAEAALKHAHNQDELIAGTWLNGWSGSSGLGLMGYRGKFDGLGLIFKGGDDPSLSVAVGDGNVAYSFDEQGSPVGKLPSADALKFNWQSGKQISVTVRVRPDRTEVKVDDVGTIEVKKPMSLGGYLGITSWGGNKETYNPVLEKSASIELKGLTVTNHDDVAVGEEKQAEPAPEPEISQEMKEDILHKHSSFKVHRDESSAIKALGNAIFKLIIETKPEQEKMQTMIHKLGDRITSLEGTFTQLKAEIDKKTGHRLGEEFDAIKKELLAVHQVAKEETALRNEKIQQLHSEMKNVASAKKTETENRIASHLEKLQKSNKMAIKNMEEEKNRVFGVSAFAVVLILIGGIALYQKFRTWEKKHVL